jgi:hypothetical protein
MQKQSAYLHKLFAQNAQMSAITNKGMPVAEFCKYLSFNDLHLKNDAGMGIAI